MAETRNDFTKGSIPRTVTRLALPMIGAQIINAFYSMVDKLYIGMLPANIATPALAGVGLAFPLIMIVSAFAMLAGMGGAALCSIARGEKKYDYAERVMGNSFSLLIIFGACLTIVSLLVKGPVLTFMGASSETFLYADEYATIYLCGSLFVMMTLGMNPYINAQGFARVGMVTVTLGAVMNIILDPVFMFSLGMGVKGAALATILSQAVSAVWVMAFLTGKKCILRLRRKNLALDGAIAKRILALGASNATMNVTECIVSIACNKTLAIYGGTTYVGVMAAISAVRQILMMPVSGFGQGLQPVMGYNYGALHLGRVRESFKFTTLVTACYAGTACLLIQLFPEAFMRLFTRDIKLIEAGVPALRMYFSLFFMLSLQMAGQYSFVALGKSKQAVFFSLLRKAFIVAPLAVLLPRVTDLGVMGVFAAEPISDFVGSTACFTTFMLTMWPKLKTEEGRVNTCE